MQLNGKVVLITGASSGIGEALAYEFAKSKPIIILCARNEKELQRVRANITETGCEFYRCDITDHAAVDAMIGSIMERFGKVDILVNNAGISQRGLAVDTDYSVDERIMQLNFFATVYLTKKILPEMISRGGGEIIVISSLSGKFGFWQRSAYSASKHALQGYFETLQIELKEYNIHTLIVNPGGVNTNIAKNALKSDGSNYGKVDDFHIKGIKPEELAKRILNAMQKHKKQLLTGKMELVMYYIKKYWPWLFFRIAEKVKR
jgi:dehydrogenase/reductase SDR family protein 7B